MIFHDPILENSFKQRGFAIAEQCFNREEIDFLLNYHIEFNSQLDSGFKTSVWSSNAFYRKKTFEMLQPIYNKNFGQILSNHHGIMGNYMIKEARKSSSIDIHADWAFTNEKEFSAINAWVPLVDTTIENGCLRIIPYSNHFNYEIRGRGIVHQFESIKDHMENIAEPLEVKAGDAILFNVKCIHFSKDNLSNQSRPAVSMVMTPKRAEILHYTALNDKQVRKITVDDSLFFAKYSAFEEIPPQAKEEVISFNRSQKSKQDFNDIYEISCGKKTLKSKWNKFIGKHKMPL